VFGAYVATPLPKPRAKTPSPSTPVGPTCASTPPSAYLISPDHVAAGGSTSFLLACAKPASLGFKGAFAPLEVLIHDEGSFQNLHYVNGYLQPISASFPVRPLVSASFTVAGPYQLLVTVPGSLQPGTYVTIVSKASATSRRRTSSSSPEAAQPPIPLATVVEPPILPVGEPPPLPRGLPPEIVELVPPEFPPS